MSDEQKKLLELLQNFAQTCKDNDLQFFLVGGTLLGAVRHKGFIPWDDDIDVAMPIEDYNAFLKLRKSLPNGLIIQSEEYDDSYPFFFCKLCDPRTPFLTGNEAGPLGVYIDIFPLVPSCEPCKKASFIFNISTVIGYVLQVKLGWLGFIPYKKTIAKAGFAMLNLLSVKFLKRLRARLLSTLEAQGTDYCFSPGGGHKGLVEFYPKSWFDTAKYMVFEGDKFPVPRGWDGYLKQLYGEYMVLPPEAERYSLHKG